VQAADLPERGIPAQGVDEVHAAAARQEKNMAHAAFGDKVHDKI